jgi:hypothetical protein
MAAPLGLGAPSHHPIAVRRALEFVQAVARSEWMAAAAQAAVADDWRREAREIVAALGGEPSGT